MSFCELCQHDKISDCEGGISTSDDGTGACVNFSRWLPIRDLLDTWPLNPRYAHASFDPHPKSNPEQAKDARGIKKAMIDALGQRRNIYLFGGQGNGKTYAAAALVREAHRQFIPAVMVDCVDLINTITARMKSEDGYQGMLDQLASAEIEILVIDDLGKQRRTDFANDKMWEIINGRYQQQLMTVATSNYTPSEIAAQGEPWPKLMDRLQEDAIILKMQGESLRV